MARDYWFAFGNPPSTYTGLSPSFITFVNGSGATIAPPSIAETYSGTGLYKASYNATQTIAFVLDGATSGLNTANRYIAGVFDPQDQFGSTLTAIGPTLTAIGATLFGIGTSNIALGTSNLAIGTTLLGFGQSNIALGTSNFAFGASNLAIGTTILSWVNNISSSLTVQGTSLVAMGDTLSTLATYVGSTASSFGDSSTDPATVFGYAKRVVEFLEGDQTYTKSSGGLVFTDRAGLTTLASKTVSDTSTQTTKT